MFRMIFKKLKKENFHEKKLSLNKYIIRSSITPYFPQLQKLKNLFTINDISSKDLLRNYTYCILWNTIKRNYGN